MAVTEQILPHLYTIKIPLPKSPLKALNSYVVLGLEKTLIIDTGFDRSECLAAMHQGLAELKVDLDRTDLFITHLHADHLGLASKLVRPGRIVYFNGPDSEQLRTWPGWDAMIVNTQHNGFPPDELEGAIRNHPGYRFFSQIPEEMTLLAEGESLAVGDYLFRCISTPGHTAGHLCLYEQEKRILISGDHVLHDITPNITGWRENGNALRNYLESLDKIEKLEIDLVLPGHRRRFGNPAERIAELKHHHRIRNEEILKILHDGALTAYDIAARMTWDLDCASWQDFPLPQKWFATGEALAHLRYLQSEGKVHKESNEPIIRYTLS